jgi:DNA-binding NtrC family response regulator
MKRDGLFFEQVGARIIVRARQLSADHVAELLDGPLPAVWVVDRGSLDAIRLLPGEVVDRGVKDARVGLARRLVGVAGIGDEGVLMIDGNYRDTAQIPRGVKALLEAARRNGERSVYVIGARPDLFKELWKKHAEKGEIRRTESQGPTALLDFLTPREDRDGLAARYLGQAQEVELVRQLILRAAELDDVPLFILGPSGTGKELVAREVHHHSRRCYEPFIPLNCGAIPDELLESTLFGHVPGAFTDARKRKRGLWELAGKGTLFLDEIGDLELHHQAKILRTLEDRKIWPVGGEREIPVRARVVAATNRDIGAMVREGKFREDLFYRLDVLVIRTPALCDHPEDVPMLARHFWRMIAGDDENTLPSDMLEFLSHLPWRGNIRELRTVLTRLHALFRDQELSAEHLRQALQHGGAAVAGWTEDTDDSSIATHRAACFDHLRRTHDILDRIGRRVRAVSISGDEVERDDLPFACEAAAEELEVLCGRPLRFHGEITAREVGRLGGVLSDFANEAGQNGVALAQEQTKEIAERIEDTARVVFQEIERVMGRSTAEEADLSRGKRR